MNWTVLRTFYKFYKDSLEIIANHQNSKLVYFDINSNSDTFDLKIFRHNVKNIFEI